MKSIRQIYKIGHGPSSSHTMGPAYACEKFKQEFNGANEFKAILYGSLALTGKGHLTDKTISEIFAPTKNSVEFNIKEKNIKHPNTFDLVAIYKDKQITRRYYSIGGGDLQIEGLERDLYKEIYKENTFNEVKNYISKNNISLIDYIIKNEGIEIKDYLKECYRKMVEVINNGLSKEGPLPGKLHVLRKAKEISSTKTYNILNNTKDLYSYAFAVAEENAAGEIIVTAPTCGSCGVLPAVLYYSQKNYGYSEDKIIESLMIAGIIGNVIKTNASISGAEAGCQAEIGAACSMAAAAYSYLLGGNIEQIEQSAEIALEHHLGLTCDPVDGYVQIPCIERNGVCALRAIDSANLVIYIKPSESKISFDMVVRTMLTTGKALNSDYRETAKGGLAKEFYK